MMSQAAPIAETHPKEGDMASMSKGSAFVSVYNDGDISEYLYTTPAFASGFLPLEPEEEAKTTQSQPPKHTRPITIKSARRPTETFNTGTTPTKATSETEPTAVPTPIELAETTQHKVVERRPSFIEVTMPHVHGHGHDHDHKDAHHGHHEHRRHSSSSQRAMGWWPETEEKSQHDWVEADEEEDVIEDGYYASYD